MTNEGAQINKNAARGRKPVYSKDMIATFDHYCNPALVVNESNSQVALGAMTSSETDFFASFNCTFLSGFEDLSSEHKPAEQPCKQWILDFRQARKFT